MTSSPGQVRTARRENADEPANSCKETANEPERDGKEADSESGPLQNQGVSEGLKREKLAYLGEMLGELRQLCVGMDERMIAYLIEMALIETNTALSQFDFETELGSTASRHRKEDRKTG